MSDSDDDDNDDESRRWQRRKMKVATNNNNDDDEGEDEDEKWLRERRRRWRQTMAMTTMTMRTMTSDDNDNDNDDNDDVRLFSILWAEKQPNHKAILVSPRFRPSCLSISTDVLLLNKMRLPLIRPLRLMTYWQQHHHKTLLICREGGHLLTPRQTAWSILMSLTASTSPPFIFYTSCTVTTQQKWEGLII